MTTTLKISIALGATLTTTTAPTREDLQAVSTLALSNGTFSLAGMNLLVDHSVGVGVEFIDASTVAVTAMGLYSASQKRIVFPSSLTVIGGLCVQLIGTPAPKALIGVMSHRLGTGSMVVSSTGNPAGDRLESARESRQMALIP